MDRFDVKIEAFEGPFELLFHLIEKHEMDIYDIPIAELTEQYMRFLGVVNYDDMDGMSRFVLMAATLLEIKSAMLLPKPQTEDGEEEDPRAALAQMLLEYKRFKDIAAVLKDKEAAARFFL
jgi:segregation and condensation protein A